MYSLFSLVLLYSFTTYVLGSMSSYFSIGSYLDSKWVVVEHGIDVVPSLSLTSRSSYIECGLLGLEDVGQSCTSAIHLNDPDENNIYYVCGHGAIVKNQDDNAYFQCRNINDEYLWHEISAIDEEPHYAIPICPPFQPVDTPFQLTETILRDHCYCPVGYTAKLKVIVEDIGLTPSTDMYTANFFCLKSDHIHQKPYYLYDDILNYELQTGDDDWLEVQEEGETVGHYPQLRCISDEESSYLGCRRHFAKPHEYTCGRYTIIQIPQHNHNLYYECVEVGGNGRWVEQIITTYNGIQLGAFSSIEPNIQLVSLGIWNETRWQEDRDILQNIYEVYDMNNNITFDNDFFYVDDHIPYFCGIHSDPQYHVCYFNEEEKYYECPHNSILSIIKNDQQHTYICDALWSGLWVETTIDTERPQRVRQLPLVIPMWSNDEENEGNLPIFWGKRDIFSGGSSVVIDVKRLCNGPYIVDDLPGHCIPNVVDLRCPQCTNDNSQSITITPLTRTHGQRVWRTHEIYRLELWTSKTDLHWEIKRLINRTIDLVAFPFEISGSVELPSYTPETEPFWFFTINNVTDISILSARVQGWEIDVHKLETGVLNALPEKTNQLYMQFDIVNLPLHGINTQWIVGRSGCDCSFIKTQPDNCMSAPLFLPSTVSTWRLYPPWWFKGTEDATYYSDYAPKIENGFLHLSVAVPKLMDRPLDHDHQILEIGTCKNGQDFTTTTTIGKDPNGVCHQFITLSVDVDDLVGKCGFSENAADTTLNIYYPNGSPLLIEDSRKGTADQVYKSYLDFSLALPIEIGNTTHVDITVSSPVPLMAFVIESSVNQTSLTSLHHFSIIYEFKTIQGYEIHSYTVTFSNDVNFTHYPTFSNENKILELEIKIFTFNCSLFTDLTIEVDVLEHVEDEPDVTHHGVINSTISSEQLCGNINLLTNLIAELTITNLPESGVWDADDIMEGTFKVHSPEQIHLTDFDHDHTELVVNNSIVIPKSNYIISETVAGDENAYILFNWTISIDILTGYLESQGYMDTTDVPLAMRSRIIYQLQDHGPHNKRSIVERQLNGPTNDDFEDRILESVIHVTIKHNLKEPHDEKNVKHHQSLPIIVGTSIGLFAIGTILLIAMVMFVTTLRGHPHKTTGSNSNSSTKGKNEFQQSYIELKQHSVVDDVYFDIDEEEIDEEAGPSCRRTLFAVSNARK